ncbi:hypothetical protein BGZ73_006514 [Actinomortierella ambigua]|nr:hypothetical protein BGZ73_006514 [Actinomortierella ambigua]
MSRTSINSILSIPHIQNAIAKYFSRADLKRCCTVSSDWWEIFTPILWQQLVFRIDADRDYYESAASQAILSKYGRFVRRIRVYQALSLGAIGPHCQFITHMSMLWTDDDAIVADFEARLREFTQFIKSSSCQQLQSMTIYAQRWLTTSGLLTALSPVSSAVSQSLRSLSLHYPPYAPGSSAFLLDLLLGLPKLEHLYLQMGYPWNVDHDESLLRNSTFGLKSLSLTPDFDDADAAISFWRQCPRITVFKTHWIVEKSVFANFVSLFDDRDAEGQPVRSVGRLVLPEGRAAYTVADEQLSRILRGCVKNSLTILGMGACPLGPEAFKALLETQSQSLWHLHLSGTVVEGTNASPWIQRLLSSCPRLTVLNVKHSHRTIARGAHLHADDILKGPWICSDLANFHVPIIGIPSAGSPEQGDGRDRATVIDRVMQQIGKMTNLMRFGTSTHAGSRLDTGVVSPEAFVDNNTLPFSLGTGGLQHLAGLTMLQMFGVRRCAIDIGTEEAMFMTQHWRPFRQVQGFLRLSDKKAMDALEWFEAKGTPSGAWRPSKSSKSIYNVTWETHGAALSKPVVPGTTHSWTPDHGIPIKNRILGAIFMKLPIELLWNISTTRLGTTCDLIEGVVKCIYEGARNYDV